MDQIRAKTLVKTTVKIYDSPLTSVSTHFTLMGFQIFMHKLHLHLGPNKVSIYSLNLV